MDIELRWRLKRKGQSSLVLEKTMDPGVAQRGLRGAEERKEREKLRRLGLYSCRGGGVATVMAAGCGKKGERGRRGCRD